ncbi:MAG: PTS system mannose/fructose/sorbose family transporter subunit IID [Erysipelotrichaceae bacterium]
MSEEKKLTQKIIRKSYFNWMIFNLSLYQPETMQAPALVKMFGDIREDFYPNDVEAQQALMERHLPFFNTEPFLGCLVPGIVLGMEAQKAEGADIPDDLIMAIKSALMGPFAGIGDALLPGTLIPILLSIGLGLSSNGEITGVLFYIFSFLAIMIPLTWFLFTKGCKLGTQAAELILGSDIKDQVIRAVNIIGLSVVGAISCSYANINLGLKYVNGDYTLVGADVVNKIFPNLLVLLAGIGSYYLVAKKNWSATKMIGLYFVIAVIGYFTGILA